MKFAFCSLILLFGFVAHAGAICDSRTPFEGLDGRALIDCRVDGARAEARYKALAVAETELTDDDGGASGFVKQDAEDYCFASLHRTTYECSQTLDAASDRVLPLNASVMPRRSSCAMTNGTDVCSARVPCCNSGDVCVGIETGSGFCD